MRCVPWLSEELAAESVKAQATAKVAKVFDQYINFVSLGANMFSLAQKNAYVAGSSLVSLHLVHRSIRPFARSPHHTYIRHIRRLDTVLHHHNTAPPSHPLTHLVHV